MRYACAELLRKQKTIPAEIAEFLLKVELGVEQPPSPQKIGKNYWRDERIFRCVQDLEKFAGIQRSKSYAGRNSAFSAFEVVADATGLTSNNVSTIFYRFSRVTDTAD